MNFIWRVHPARENIFKTVAVSFFILLIGVLSALFMEHFFYFFFAVGVLFLGLGSFFLPTTFGVDEKGVIKKIAGQKWGKTWGFFKRYKVHEDGIFLSPIPHKSVLDRFQGWFLPTDDKSIKDFVLKMMESVNESAEQDK